MGALRGLSPPWKETGLFFLGVLCFRIVLACLCDSLIYTALFSPFYAGINVIDFEETCRV